VYGAANLQALDVGGCKYYTMLGIMVSRADSAFCRYFCRFFIASVGKRSDLFDFIRLQAG
jgi:hypothetical protein